MPEPFSAWGKSSVALLLVNNDNNHATVSVNLSTVVGLGLCGSGSDEQCTARDAAARVDMSNVTNNLVSATMLS